MKNTRHTKILELIKKYDVETQEDLARLLAESGLKVTQATVCRDIKELRLIKAANEHGVYKYVQAGSGADVTASKQQKTILTQTVTSVDFAQNIVIIKTAAGMAQAAAVVIDSMNLEEIMGSLAGDDTLLCIVKTEDVAKNLTLKIQSLL